MSIYTSLSPVVFLACLAEEEFLIFVADLRISLHPIFIFLSFVNSFINKKDTVDLIFFNSLFISLFEHAG